MNAPEELVEQLSALLTPTTVIVCVGSELRGDDAAGVAAARELAGSVPWEVIDARTAPESFLGRIAGRRPGSVLVIDALSFGAPAGTIRLVEPSAIEGQGPSSHGPAPALFLEALAAMHPCRCAVLGIQAGSLELGSPLSPPVAEAVRQAVEILRQVANGKGTDRGADDRPDDRPRKMPALDPDKGGSGRRQ